MRIYVVQRGDTLNEIAAESGVSASQIALDNQLIYPYELAVGQALLLSETNGTNIGQNLDHADIGDADINRTATGDYRNIYVSGYAYPFISRWVLEQTLPYLSELPIFSYGFTGYGELLAPELDETWMITAAQAKGVAPVLTLTPLGPDGRFNNNLISSVVNNSIYTQNLIQNLLEVMERKEYQGVNIDFEYIQAQDRDAFTGFVRQVAETMRRYGYRTSVALAPKVSADQEGLLYQGKDYGGLGAVADHVLLMTYEWGYTYGPPMAVAPLNQVRRVVEYALEEIPAAKIDLGIPNYGYDWPLPFVRGMTKADSIGNVEAVRIAVERGADIQFDTVAQSPYFTYYDNQTGVEHEVWFEDVRSMQARFDLIKEYGLRGCGYWQIMQWFRANWVLLADNFIIQRF